ncbi:hypothetical protein BCF11_2542 [Collimonas sp. PA-H2]|uniref:hypothetical protein n=1 Tax=Collimonas sp. PA-H2 TaxID=1881062 RepID=UPI000BF51186|nr:hypothetical protein [Collimonas sp. PA-H2]PFH10131.1 hypothetical protein BCF11_2542 [Collimonas sp. PA-H2]
MMATHLPKFTCDQVLESFAMERDVDGKALQRYLQEYPEYASQLVDLSQEIFRFDMQDESPLSVEDQMRIDSAWSRIQSAPSKATIDPLADLTVSKLREIAQALEIPRQVLTAFRERTVIVASVPNRFLTRLADLVGSNFQALHDTLAQAPQLHVRSYKADDKPLKAAQVTFEQLLRGTDLSDEQIERLLADDA